MEGKPAERPHEQDLLGLAADERAHICEEDKPQWPAHAAPQAGTLPVRPPLLRPRSQPRNSRTSPPRSSAL